MLYLEAPYYFINGVSVFRDHADPLQYYYLPAQPRLRTMTGADGVPVPRLQLIKYRTLREEDGGGGFLTFDVHLGLLQNEIDEIASEIRRLAQLPSLPRIVPIQPLDGSVRLMIFGQDSGETPAPTRPGSPGIDRRRSTTSTATATRSSPSARPRTTLRTTRMPR